MLQLQEMLHELNTMDVGFLASISKLISSCRYESVYTSPLEAVFALSCLLHAL